jgi:hypothetical protein
MALHAPILEQRVHRFFVAVDHVEHAVRHPGFGEELGQPQRHGRVPFRGLQDEGVAGGQRRAGLPERDHGGKVERGYPGNHT